MAIIIKKLKVGELPYDEDKENQRLFYLSVYMVINESSLIEDVTTFNYNGAHVFLPFKYLL